MLDCRGVVGASASIEQHVDEDRPTAELAPLVGNVAQSWARAGRWVRAVLLP